jgi:hypothetical protein
LPRYSFSLPVLDEAARAERVLPLGDFAAADASDTGALSEASDADPASLSDTALDEGFNESSHRWNFVGQNPMIAARTDFLIPSPSWPSPDFLPWVQRCQTRSATPPHRSDSLAAVSGHRGVLVAAVAARRP